MTLRLMQHAARGTPVMAAMKSGVLGTAHVNGSSSLTIAFTNFFVQSDIILVYNINVSQGIHNRTKS